MTNLEAEAVAFVVGQAVGLEAAAISYGKRTAGIVVMQYVEILH
jgi:hypothetical protein